MFPMSMFICPLGSLEEICSTFVSVSWLEWKPAKTISWTHIVSLGRLCSEQHCLSHHHEVSTLGLVYHWFLPSAEVHHILFSQLDFDLNAGNYYRCILTFWSTFSVSVLILSHLPLTTLIALCLFAITQSIVKSSYKWSHCSTRSPWNRYYISGISTYITPCRTHTFECFYPHTEVW